MVIKKQKKIALLFSSFRAGGVEQVQINLAEEFSRRGFGVDVVVINSEGPLRHNIDKNVHIVDLGKNRTLRAIPALVRYLRNSSPDAMVASQTHNNAAAIISKLMAGVSTRLIVSEHNDFRTAVKSRSIKEKLRPFVARLSYPLADVILAVSHGVADAVAEKTGIPRPNIHTIYNPVVTNKSKEKMNQDLSHPVFDQRDNPIIIIVGRLSPKKNHINLLKAFKLIIQKIDAYLLIVGDGDQRKQLEEKVNNFGIEHSTFFMGYQPNPYPFMRKSNICVLSSDNEGLPTVLIEAMACGTPVVSTDCPSGPAEILEGGKYGRLVPVRDPQALADAILETLKDPVDTELLKQRADDFSVEKIADQYLQLIFPKQD